MQIMCDSQFQYKSNQNQFQNEYDGRNDMIVSRIIAYFSKRKTIIVWRQISSAATKGFYMNHQFVRVFSLDCFSQYQLTI